MKIKRGLCPHCGPGPAICDPLPHLMFLAISVITCGLFFPLWMIAVILSKYGIFEEAKCQKCGSRVSKYKSAPKPIDHDDFVEPLQ